MMFSFDSKQTMRTVTFLSLYIHLLTACISAVIINEVAYKGSTGMCDGADWIELFNNATTNVNLANYTLHDDKGRDDEDAKIFGNELSLAAGEYKVLCRKVDFEFGIGSSDSVTLLSGSGSVVSSCTLPGTGGDDQTYAYFSNGYNYTATPTPGTLNIYTKPKSLFEELEEQNALGRDFFRLNDDGTEKQDSDFPKVVDLFVDMEVDSLSEIENHPARENYVPFTNVRVVHTYFDTELATAGAGRIRTKGQSTLSLTACYGFENVPFNLKFDAPLYGMETAYLRNHYGDLSFMREYAVHRLNGRFGLPFLRVRPVRLYINGRFIGFYSMMEAPDQGYVMQVIPYVYSAYLGTKSIVTFNCSNICHVKNLFAFNCHHRDHLEHLILQQLHYSR